MKIVGAKISVDYCGIPCTSDLMRVTYGEKLIYFIKDAITREFDILCCKNVCHAFNKLKESRAKPFTPLDPDAEESFEIAINSRDRVVWRSQLEAFAVDMKKQGLWAQE